MGFIYANRIYLIIGLLLQIINITCNTTISYNNAGCSNELQCLKCNSFGCIKCPHLINIDTRECLKDYCPSGYNEQWSTEIEFIGKICKRTGYSNSIIAIIVGIVVGLVVCIIFVIVGIYLIKRQSRKKSTQQTFMDDTIERVDFLRQLDEFRANADYFLAILNDTRRQIRKLHQSGDISGAMSYHSVIRDLAKLLLLLNKSNEAILGPPHDWNRLLSWAEYLLEHHKPQLAQLIDFLQAPNIPLAPDPRQDSYQHSTFKSNITRSTVATTSDSSTDQQTQLYGSLISLHEFEQPRSSNPFGSVNNLKYYYQSPEMNGSSLWLEDEFFKLGFRPQDEITTEL